MQREAETHARNANKARNPTWNPRRNTNTNAETQTQTPNTNTNTARNPLWNTNINTKTAKPIPKQKHKCRNSDGGLGLGAWVGDKLRKKDGWSLAGERHTQIEQCDRTIKAPLGQGRQDSGEKLGSGSEWRGFSLCAGPGSLLLFPLGFGRLGFFFLCLYLKVTLVTCAFSVSVLTCD